MADLDCDVLNEVVREGEAMLQAQFAAANSADQRSLAWAGFIITIGTAAVGGTGALVMAGGHVALAGLSAFVAGAMTISAFYAVDSVRPRKFAFPGNEPECWLPSNWQHPIDRSIKQAKLEQATVLNNLIDDNRKSAEQVGKQLQKSIDIAFWTIVMATILVIAGGALGLIR